MNPRFDFDHPRQRDHLNALAELLTQAFPGHGAFPDAVAFRDRYLTNSAYAWERSWVALDAQDALAAHCGVFLLNLRVGAARLRVGGIGGVATRSSNRRQGLMRGCLDRCHDDIAAAGCGISLLSAVPGVYGRFGYVRAWSDATYRIDADALPSAPAEPTTPFSPTCQPGLIARYNEHAAALTGTAIRPTYSRQIKNLAGTLGLSWGDWGGYVLARPSLGVLQVGEVAGDPESALAVIRDLAAEQACDRIALLGVHEGSAIAARLRDEGCEIERVRRDDAGWLARLSDAGRALTQISATLSARLQASPFADREVRLALLDGPDAAQRAELHWNAGHLTVGEATGATSAVLETQGKLVQLLLGTDPPDVILKACRPSGTEVAALARVLFPHQHPKLAWADSF